MSTQPEQKSPLAELDLDLHFLPAWAQKAPDTNRYAKYTGDEGEGGRGFRDRGDRGPRGGSGGGGQRSGPRPGGGAPQGFGGPRPGGPGGDRRGPRPGGPGGDRRPGGFRGGPGQRPEERREALPPLPEVDLNFVPEEKGVESLARQIKLTGRAYPLFEIAMLVLKKPERYHVQLSSARKEGKALHPFFRCQLDESLWFSEAEAVGHILDKHFGTFYSAEKIPTDPPKGVYTFVAQCGISGVILGPPNYHDYQNKLRKLHQDRFSRMNFDMFKSRIKIVREEAVVKKWLDEQSFRTEFTALNVPDVVKLASREEVEAHFRATHLANVVKMEESMTLSGPQTQALNNRPFPALVRRAWDDQCRFPIRVVNILSQQFARYGLQFFKVNKTVTHVAVARPHFLDMEATPPSDGVRKIMAFIDAHPKTTRRKLIEAFAPGSTKPAPAVEAPPAPAEGEAAAAPAAPVDQTPPSPELESLIRDLHWLVHQGHVIEFANGLMETAKRPAPKPVREPKKTEATPAVTPAAETAAAVTEAAPAEAAPETAGEVTTVEISQAAPEAAPAAPSADAQP